MTRNLKKLKWERVDDSFDLRIVNPEVLNPHFLKVLFRGVEHTKSWGRYFSSEAKNEFKRWLDNVDTPLKEQAYARLSNWFLCDMKFIRETDLAKAASQFWDSLFCSKPDRRLTSPKKDHKILKEEFDLWWPKQLRCQDDC
jgi:hypothetical protein